MAIYTFVNGVRKTVFAHYPKVIVGGRVKTVVAGYTFINGVRHILFSRWGFSHSEVYTNTNNITTLNLTSPGKYLVVVRGAGGSGGEQGGTSAYTPIGVGGQGGCGGKGAISVGYITINAPTSVKYYVGGAISTNAGNGGQGGWGGAATGGKGGAGGFGSWVHVIGQPQYVYANGGAGGGGGGACGSGGVKYSGSNGGGGGGGGGRYYLTLDASNYQFIQNAVNGANGGVANLSSPTNGGDGDTTTFPDLYGGKGGWASDGGGTTPNTAKGGWGGGAGGGAGMTWASSHHYKAGGQGGGGAGGDNNAGGGETPLAETRGSTNPSNVKFTPDETLRENQQYGVFANYGQGGNANGGQGAQGFVLIRRIKE